MIYGIALGLATDIAKEKLYPIIKDAVLNERAQRHVKKTLREKYDSLFTDASYDNVMANITLAKSDYEIFLRNFKTEVSLAEHLKNILLRKSQKWQYSSQNRTIFNDFIEDVYIAYEKIFSSKDMLFVIFKLLVYSKDFEKRIEEIKTSPALIPPHFLTTPYVNIIDRADLVGRENDIQAVRESLENSKKSVMVNSMGGVGKTMLCKYLYSEYCEVYTQIGWFNYQESMRESLLTQISDKCFPDSYKDMPADDQYTEIKDYLRSLSSDSLLIVDNIESPDKDLDEIKFLTSLPCQVLATSREQLAGFNTHQLGFLCPDECFKLFQNIINFEEEEAASVRDIVTLTGQHTLTLDLLAKTCKEGRYQPNELLTKLQDEGFTLTGISENVSTDWHDAKGKSFFEHLQIVFAINGLSSGAEHILINLSVLPSQFMPVHMIKELLGLDNLNDLNELHRKGYLICSADEQEIYVHKVIREVVKHNKKPSYTDCKVILDNLLKKSTGKVTDSLVSRSWLIPLLKEVLISLSENVLTATLCNNLSTIYLAMNELPSALEFQLKALKICKSSLSENDPSAAALYSNLSLIYYEMHEHIPARNFQLKALEICKVSLPENHHGLATSYNNLSLIYQDMGDIENAYQFQSKAVEIREIYLTENHPDLAISYNNLGLIYQAMNNLPIALEFQLKAQKIREISLSENHPDLATSYNNLALIHQAMNELPKALEYQLKALNIRETSQPDNHPDLATSYCNLASVYQEMNELEKALEYQLKAIKIREIALPNNHPDLANSYNNIASTYQAMSDFSNALDFHSKDIEISEITLPPNHQDLATSYINVANTYFLNTQHQKSIDYLMKTIKILFQNINQNDKIKNCLNFIALNLKALGISDLNATIASIIKEIFNSIDGKVYYKFPDSK